MDAKPVVRGRRPIRVGQIGIRCAAASMLLGFWLPICAQSQNPLDASGFPLNKPKDNRLPPPMPPEAASYEFKIISSAESSIDDKNITGKTIVFEFRGYRGHADELVGDLQTQDFVLKGHVDLLGQDAVIKGDAVYINFDSRIWRAFDANVDIKPALVQQRLLSDLYLQAALIYGDRHRADAQNANATTCDLDDPHYKLESDSLTYIPEKRIVFRGFRLRVLDKTILGLPSLTIPLTRNASNYAPDIGESADEGFYVKLAYNFPIGDDTGTLLAQFRSKLGYSLGAQYLIDRTHQKSFVRFLSDFDPGTNRISMTAALQHKQELNFGTIRIEHSTRQFSYLDGPQTVSNATFAQFVPKLGRQDQMALDFKRSELLDTNFRSVQSDLQFSETRNWTQKLRSVVRLTYTDYQASESGSTLIARQALDVRFTSLFDEAHYSAQLDYNRVVPIGETQNFASGVDRTPEITIKTDSKKLYGPNFPLNFEAAAFVGHYLDNFTNSDITRYAFDFRTSSFSKKREGLQLDYDLGFRQGFYSDNTAQYTPKANIRLGYSAGNWLQANFRYNYSQMFGFTPLAVDRSGAYNLTSFDLMTQPLPGLKFGGQVGFDFRRQDQGRIAWTSPSIRLEYSTREDFRVRALAIYDSDNQQWNSVRLDFRWKPGRSTVAASAVYDARRNSWGNINLFFDAITVGRLSFSAIATYNGYLKRFDTMHLSFTYDLHCAEAVFQIIDNRTGFRPGTEYLFFVRIKALPFASPFGIGRQGESLGAGGGGNG